MILGKVTSTPWEWLFTSVMAQMVTGEVVIELAAVPMRSTPTAI